MIRNIGILAGFIASLFIFLYVLMYLLRDWYSITNNNSIKKYINKTLPILTKYNPTFLVMIFIFGIIHFFSLANFNIIINSGYVILFILLIIFKITFFPSNKNDLYNYFNILSYLLLGSLIIHIII